MNNNLINVDKETEEFPTTYSTCLNMDDWNCDVHKMLEMIKQGIVVLDNDTPKYIGRFTVDITEEIEDMIETLKESPDYADFLEDDLAYRFHHNHNDFMVVYSWLEYIGGQLLYNSIIKELNELKNNGQFENVYINWDIFEMNMEEKSIQIEFRFVYKEDSLDLYQ